MARAIEVARAQFKALKEAGHVEGTFKDWYDCNKKEVARAQFKALKEAGQVEGTFKDWYDRKKKEVESTSVEDVLATIQTAVEATNEVQQEVAEAVRHNKAVLARVIFDEETAKAGGNVRNLVRKDVLKRFIDEAGLTKAGANTYYQNMRVKAGVVDQLKSAS